MTRDEILSANDLATDTFPAGKWGEVTIIELDGEQREDLENMIQGFKANKSSKKSVRATAAVYSLRNPDGTPMFTLADIPALAKKSGVALDAVFDRVLKLNAMTSKEAEVVAGN